jgi:predicted Zn-dependent peptidase
VPNNAVLAIVGDFEPAEAKQFIEKYFAGIPSVKLPAQPDISEPRQEKEKRAIKKDSLANKPALAFAYQMPERNTPEYYAMGLLDQLLLQGNDSKLYQTLVQKKGYTSTVSGGINYLGNMFNYKGPMLWMGDLIHDSAVPADSVVRELDRVIADIDKNGVAQPQLDLARVKLRSALYDNVSSGFGRADMLASLALFDNKPDRINTLEDEFRKITPAIIQRTVREYLRPTNRTLLFVEPVKKAN